MDFDLNVNSYKTCELYDFFSIHDKSTEKDLANAYSKKKEQAHTIYDRSQRVAFETFLNDAFDIVRAELAPPTAQALTLPKRPNAGGPPEKSLPIQYLLTVDSTFRTNKDTSTSTDFVVDLPMKFERVTKIEMVSSEIPLTSYNFSKAQDTHQFDIAFYASADDTEAAVTKTFTIPDGAWYASELAEFINDVLGGVDHYIHLLYSVDDQSGRSMFRFRTDDELEDDDLSSSARTYSHYKIYNTSTLVTFEKSCLFTLGFIETDVENMISEETTFDYGNYTYTGALVSSSVFGVTFDDYYYIYMNDFVNNGPNHQLIGIQDEGYIGNNIIGRITISGSSFTRNVGGGSYVTRTYFGDVRIRKLHIKILNKYGDVVDLGYSNVVLLIRITREHSSRKYEQIV